MRRREFITLFGGTAATWPLAARAQQPAGRVYRVGYLTVASREQQLHLIKAFEEGLRNLGYRVGENVVIEYRFANAEMDRLSSLAAELVRLKVDVIVTGANANTVAVMKATSTIPIVMAISTEPADAGLVTNLARPGGNVTGLTGDAGDEIYGKRVELLRDILPALSRVGVLWNPGAAPNFHRVKLIEEVAQTMGAQAVSVRAQGRSDLEPAFTKIVKEGAQAVVVLADAVLFNYGIQISALAVKNRLPTASAFRELAQAGLLLTYGVDNRDLWRRASIYVDKILKGAKPADLPVEQPTKYELIINLLTAKALGLSIPPTLLARADEVIE
jgi:putative tryptophan/tyrosine transport system substrate-binding protein